MSLRGSRRHQQSAATLHQELDNLSRLDNKADRDDHPLRATPSLSSSQIAHALPADNNTLSPVTQRRSSPPPPSQQPQAPDTHNTTTLSLLSHKPSSSNSLMEGSLLSVGSTESGTGSGTGSIPSSPSTPYPPSFASGHNSLDELSHASRQYFSTFSTSPTKVSFLGTTRQWYLFFDFSRLTHFSLVSE